ncbi:hypothetical protein M080_1470 [Bacteroides fragilis str. 3397 T10]|nr:hypothetical protein M080_2496 [Bacteroides fragilis str. 3397 T10]EXY28080.1 hypothetical protein M080_1470 [Bacteroides fragilis str. 3397 T10]
MYERLDGIPLFLPHEPDRVESPAGRCPGHTIHGFALPGPYFLFLLFLQGRFFLSPGSNRLLYRDRNSRSELPLVIPDQLLYAPDLPFIPGRIRRLLRYRVELRKGSGFACVLLPDFLEHVIQSKAILDPGSEDHLTRFRLLAPGAGQAGDDYPPQQDYYNRQARQYGCSAFPFPCHNSSYCWS